MRQRLPLHPARQPQPVPCDLCTPSAGPTSADDALLATSRTSLRLPAGPTRPVGTTGASLRARTTSSRSKVHCRGSYHPSLPDTTSSDPLSRPAGGGAGGSASEDEPGVRPSNPHGGGEGAGQALELSGASWGGSGRSPRRRREQRSSGSSSSMVAAWRRGGEVLRRSRRSKGAAIASTCTLPPSPTLPLCTAVSAL